MAKKVLLKDENKIEILPITRGELVLDSSGNQALHSDEFLATNSLPGLMSAEDKNNFDKSSVAATTSTTYWGDSLTVNIKGVEKTLTMPNKPTLADLTNNLTNLGNVNAGDVNQPVYFKNGVPTVSNILQTNVYNTILEYPVDSWEEIKGKNPGNRLAITKYRSNPPIFTDRAYDPILSFGNADVLGFISISYARDRSVLSVGGGVNSYNTPWYWKLKGTDTATYILPTKSSTLASVDDIPTKTSQLIKDDVYMKSEVYNTSQVNELINTLDEVVGGIIDTWRPIHVQNSSGSNILTLGDGSTSGDITLKAGTNLTMSVVGSTVTFDTTYNLFDLYTQSQKGVEAYNWGNHAGKYPTYDGTGATGTWDININGTAGNADTIDGYHAQNLLPAQAYNYTNGYLVKTDIPADFNSMITFKIEGNGYQNNINIFTQGCFYNYNVSDSIINSSCTNYGLNLETIKVFNYDNVVCLWFEQTLTYQSFLITVAVSNSALNTSNRVILVSNSPMPSDGVTRLIEITPNIGLRSDNYTNYINTTNFPGLNATVTSVGLSVPTGFSVSSSPITTSGTLGITFASGYSLPTIAKQNNWDTVYNWYTGITATDTDALVNKWGEIVDFLDSVAEGTDITDEFVTRKTTQEITGAKTFTQSIKLGVVGYSWLTGMSRASLMYDNYTAIDSLRYHPIIGVKTNAENVVTLGAYINNVGFYGYKAGRVENNHDWSFTFDSATGAITHSGTIISTKFITSGGTAAQFVKGDGSLDNTTYLPRTGGTVTGRLEKRSTGEQNYIIFSRPNGTHQGYLGFYGDNNPIYIPKEANIIYTLLHSGNYKSYTPILNSSDTHATNTSVIYAPTTAGTSGQYLMSNGSGAPVWTSLPALASPYAIKFKNSAGTEVSYNGSTLVDLTDGIYRANTASCIIKSSNQTNSTLIRVYATNATKGGYGYSLNYLGAESSGTIANNALVMYADNSSATTQVIGWSLSQNGSMGIKTMSDGTSALKINGTLSVNFSKSVNDNYNEGLRLSGATTSGSWSNIQFGCDPSAVNGSHENQWIIGRNTSNEFIIGSGTQFTTNSVKITKGGNVQIPGHIGVCTTPDTTAALTFVQNLYRGNGYTAINLNNSDISGLNSIWTSNSAQDPGEGINFARNDNNWDSLTSYNGTLYYYPNRPETVTTWDGNQKIILHTGNIDEYNLTTISKSLTVTQDWMDTGISGSDISTNGTYIIQLYVNINDSINSMWRCYWSGVMSWYSYATNDSTTETDEILLHRAGHAWSNTIYLRTVVQNNNGVMKLQIAANTNISTAYTYTFKFKKVI